MHANIPPNPAPTIPSGDPIPEPGQFVENVRPDAAASARRDSDTRVRNTREWILRAFNSQVLERPYEDIQVAHLIKNAGIGRSTFYEHYRNKDELLTDSVTHVLIAFADAVLDSCDECAIRHVLEHFWEFRPRARALLNEPSAATIVRRLADLIERRLHSATSDPSSAPAIAVRLIAMQAAESQLGLVRAWLNGEAPGDSVQIAQAIARGSRALVEAHFPGKADPRLLD